MTKEDIEFLRELQHELNTQPHDEQAAPRYWGICEEKEILLPKDFGDARILMEGKMYSVEEFVEFLCENEYDLDYMDEWEELDKSNISDVFSFAEDVLKLDVYEVSCSIDDTHISNQSNVFLTKRACQKHIDQNSYHYRKPHTYAMTAWRNPEFERLLNILQTMDLNDIKITQAV